MRRFFFFASNLQCDLHRKLIQITISASIHPEVEQVRVKIALACSECKQRNYNTMKNKVNDPDRIEMKKYCKFCRKNTVHKETK